MRVCPCAILVLPINITLSGLDAPGNNVSFFHPLHKVVAKSTHFTSSWREELRLLFHGCTVMWEAVSVFSFGGHPSSCMETPPPNSVRLPLRNTGAPILLKVCCEKEQKAARSSNSRFSTIQSSGAYDASPSWSGS